MVVGLIGLAAATAAGIFGFVNARRFVRRRLRYVDAAQSPMAPLIAGVGALVLGAGVVALLGVLPIVGAFVGGGTAVVFGVSVGAGVLRGARDVRQLPGE